MKICEAIQCQVKYSVVAYLTLKYKRCSGQLNFILIMQKYKMSLSVLQAFITVGTGLLQSGFPHPFAEVRRNGDWHLRRLGGDTVLLEGGEEEGT